MKEDITRKIKEEIEKSGHPVSLKASVILNKNGWYVKNAPRYFDPKLKEFREIDIVAQRKSLLVKNATDVLVIECKKSKTHPWVFFRQNKLNVNVFSLTVDMVETTQGAVYDWLEKKIFKRHYYYKRPLYTYYFVAFENPNKVSKEIFKATNQVLSALIFYVTQKVKLLEECKKSRLKVSKLGPTFFYPVIVFDGELYEVLINEHKEEIKKTNHISLLVEYELEEPYLMRMLCRQNLRKIVFSKPFIIDIVRLDYFKEFLKNFDAGLK